MSLTQVGVIRLSGFNARAQQDVSQAVKALTRQGASEFTLDVRDNRGGLYQEGAEVAKLFLEGQMPFPYMIMQCLITTWRSSCCAKVLQVFTCTT